ncbi:hypothetical protein K435DRAFT_934828 [Dendrothele bispora CBS 962.96]|uniref:ferric-chelate reductase (NADPH) n=1 Tax=Dendrothele bispora (strain CBS 962.96) TaxID=1314807 RepID=A0A4S8L1C3_DENBC|nr:hypothetical protein K435DRAFT_934828 [Dendrothele bispora CBS 962.96]
MADASGSDVSNLIERTETYPYYMWYFTACFLGVVSLCNFSSLLFSKISRSSFAVSSTPHSDPEKNASNPNGAISFSRLPMAIVNTFRVLAYRTTINIGSSFSINLAEVVVSVVYIVALYTLAFINTTTSDGRSLSITFWSSRAGTLATSQLPLIVALGTKNNVISVLTGVGYEKLNFIHRMISRVVFILLWIHAGGMNADHFIIVGFMALLAFTLLIVISIRPVRGRAYEFFFYMHCALAIIFLGGGYYHANTEHYGAYIWPCFLIWGLDRFVRIIRLVTCNHSYFSPLSKSSEMEASTKLITSDLICLTIQRPPHFNWSPGQFAYLVAPGVSLLPFEGHPFTIELVFLINVRDGFTKRLHEVATKGETIKVLLDGPYGSRVDVDTFDNIVLVAGGSGVTYTLPILLDTIARVRSNKSKCERIVFIWSVRDAAHLRSISPTLISISNHIHPSLKIELRLFVTGSNDVDIDLSELSPSTLSSFVHLSISRGRPNLPAILEAEVEQARGRDMCVAVCGSQAIANTVRRTLGFHVTGLMTVMKSGANISLHVESFGYA